MLLDAPMPQPHLGVTRDRHRLASSIAPAQALTSTPPCPGATMRRGTPMAPSALAIMGISPAAIRGMHA